MKLSIIVPVYNAENYLHRCINSLLDQTMNEYEIILVNDGSNDKSREILEQFQMKYSHLIQVIHQENGGVGKARNTGLSYARGEYFTYIDSDDYIEPNSLDIVYTKAHDNNYDILIYDAYRDDGHHKDMLYATRLTKEEKITQNEYILSLPCPWNKIIKLSIFKEHNLKFPEGVWYEDLALIPTLALYTKNIGYLHKPIVNYYLSPNSITRQSTFNDKTLGIFPVMEMLYNAFINTEYKEELESLYVYHLLSQSSLEFYRAGKYEYINRISSIMHKRFPQWQMNKYNQFESKECIRYAKIFYFRQQKVLRVFQSLKKIIIRS